LRGVSGDSGKDADAETRVSLKEGGNSGSNVGSYQEDAIRNITGNVGVNASGGNQTSGAFYWATGNQYTANAGNEFARVATMDVSRVVPTGSDNRPKNVYVNYIIKY
jgi:hypothetical protein